MECSLSCEVFMVYGFLFCGSLPFQPFNLPTFQLSLDSRVPTTDSRLISRLRAFGLSLLVNLSSCQLVNYPVKNHDKNSPAPSSPPH
jgi:hypothetical protein